MYAKLRPVVYSGCCISEISYYGLGVGWDLRQLCSYYGMMLTFDNYGHSFKTDGKEKEEPAQTYSNLSSLIKDIPVDFPTTDHWGGH